MSNIEIECLCKSYLYGMIKLRWLELNLDGNGIRDVEWIGESIGNLSLLSDLVLQLCCNDIVDVTEVGEGIGNLSLLTYLFLTLQQN